MKKKSAGLVIIYDNKILLIHPTNAKWHGTYGIPKGKIDKEETSLDAAIRETYEEIGIKVPLNLINKERYEVIHKSSKHSRKIVYYYIVLINDLSQIGLSDVRIPKNQLQLKEVDWGGFISLSEARKRMINYQKPILDELIKKGLLESNHLKRYDEFRKNRL